MVVKSMLYSLRNSIKSAFDKSLRSIINLFIDTHLIPSECPEIPKLTQAVITLRYRFAGRGLPLTQNEKKILSYKNVFQGKRVFILGNGPSLLKCDIRKLHNEYTFGVNSIFLNYKNMGFHPNFYVVEDIYVGEDRADEINSYHGPETKFFGNYFKYCLHDSPETAWLNVRFRYENYPGFPYFSRNAARMVWVGGTVTYICLQLAYYMGFSEVYLIGFDHNYVIPNSAIKKQNLIVSTSDDPNHFHPDYFGKGYRWHDPKVKRMEQAFIRAKEYYELDGRKIYNATVGGSLEVFERVNYNNIVSKKYQ